MVKIYTKTGDKGETSLGNDQRVKKYNSNVELVGDLDELNSHIGYLLSDRTVVQDTSLNVLGKNILLRTQSILFDIGGYVAQAYKPDKKLKLQKLLDLETVSLESKIDDLSFMLEPLRSFILPGGCMISSSVHLTRTVCRRVERNYCRNTIQATVLDNSVIKYLNRLSDFLFVYARYLNRNGEETKYVNFIDRIE